MSIAICRQGRPQLQRLNLVSAPLSAPAQEIFSANVERSVSPNGEKPSGRLWILKRTVVLKFHKSSRARSRSPVMQVANCSNGISNLRSRTCIRSKSAFASPSGMLVTSLTHRGLES
jgi:hypothetical protein